MVHPGNHPEYFISIKKVLNYLELNHNTLKTTQKTLLGTHKHMIYSQPHSNTLATIWNTYTEQF